VTGTSEAYQPKKNCQEICGQEVAISDEPHSKQRAGGRAATKNPVDIESGTMLSGFLPEIFFVFLVP
jgi:hypothetical protein